VEKSAEREREYKKAAGAETDEWLRKLGGY